VTTTRRRVSSLIALCLASAAYACSGDVVLPNGAPATIVIVSGNTQSGPAGTALGQPLVVQVTDAFDRPVEGRAVAFTIDAGGGQVSPASEKTSTDGKATATWTLGAAAGQQRVQAQVMGSDVPATLLVKFSASAVSGTGSVIEIVSGDQQTGPVGSALADSLVVKVSDGLQNPVAGVPVQWTAVGGGSISPATVVTGADGLAAAERVLGNASGAQSAQASVAGISPVSFTHTAVAANPTILVLVSGDAQSGSVGAALADSLVVRLEDDNGNGVGGKAIAWFVNPGGGSVSPTTSTTNANGFARTQWTLGASTGGYVVNAVYPGLSSVPFVATASAGGPVKLAFTQVPVNTRAGATITPSVKVAIQDGNGNTVTSAQNQITLAIGTNPGSGTLSGTVTAAAVNGVATFADLSIDKAGSGYTLAASAGGLTGATSPAFDILTGSANRLVFITGPSNRVVGQTFSPAIQVQVQDAGGNPVLGALNSITITLSGTGTLSGTNPKNAVLGTATFSNLAVTTAGAAYTLTAGASGLVSATSDPFDVTQGATTVTIGTRSPGTSVPGQNVMVNYDINVTAPASSSIGGSVTVSDGTTSCTGGVTAGSGSGSCSLAFPDAGPRQLTATYSGDANLLGSVSSPVGYTVNKAGTSLSITQDTPDPSPLGSPAVTVHWNLTSSGSVPMTGNVTLSASATETCSAPAVLGAGSCDLTFTQAGTRTITASYPGDANYNAAPNAQASHGVDLPPTAVDDPAVVGDPSYTTLEDVTLNVSAGNGVLKNDSDADGPQALIARNASTPGHGIVTLNSNGSFTYKPNADYNGTDSFTYEAFDGAAASTATVTVTITAVNDAPSFTKGADQTPSVIEVGQTVDGWATGISAGPANESSQTVSFVVTTSDDSQFSVLPQVDGSTGTLTYTLGAAASGTPVTVTIHAQDDGGTTNGGVDVSPAQTFTITLTP
jgi:VCBS repeat-containing protein